MKKKFLRRLIAVGTTALISVGSVAMLAGCTTSNNPEVTITYTFNGQDYAVDYRLSRVDAPQTVQHFIELADAGFYDGVTIDGTEYKLVVHDYQSSAMHTGGYYLADSDGDGTPETLTEVDYLSTVRALEESGVTFTQSVWADEARTQPTYSVYGEFAGNGVEQENGRELSATQGALVMFYTDKGNGSEQVWVQRADGGADNDGVEYQQLNYEPNSATSLFYTFMGENVPDSTNCCVFGMAIDYEGQMTNGLLAAISEYESTLDEEAEETFTTTQDPYRLNRYDFFEDIRKGDEEAEFETPVDMPIIIKSVVVNKY